MRPLGMLAGGVMLLLGTVACGGDGTSTKSATTAGTIGPAAELTLEPCSGKTPGLFAVEPSGVLRWSRCDDRGSWWLIPVAVAGNLVYVVEYSGGEPSLVALGTDDGAEEWRYPFSSLNDGFGFNALSADDRASFAAGGVIVLEVQTGTGVDHVGLDAATGTQRWRIADDGGLVTLNTDELVVTSQGFGGDLVGSGPSGAVAAYDRGTGERRWLAEDVPYFGGGARLAGDTMVVQLYADAAPAGVMAIDLASGKERWRRDDPFWLASANAGVVLAVAGDSPMSGELVVLNPADGTERWRANASSFVAATAGEQSTATGTGATAGTVAWINPLVVDSVVVAGAAEFSSGPLGVAGKVLVGFEAGSGNERWRRETSLLARSAGPADVLLVETQHGLELVRANDGATRWRASISTATDVQAAMSDDLAVLSLRRSEMGTPSSSGSGQAAADPAARSVGCSGGTTIGGAWIPSTGPAQPVHDLTMLLSADRSSFCVINSAGTEDVVPFQPGRVVSEPEAMVVPGVLTDYLVVAVPAAWGQRPQVSVAGGQPLSSAMTPDGTVMLIVDNGMAGATPDQYIQRTFTFTGSEGQTLGEVTVDAPPTGSIDDVVACLAQHGVDVTPQATPTTAPLDKPPFDPAVAGAAWAACRPALLLSFQVSGQTLPQDQLDRLDCMAAKGFIDMFRVGENDSMAHTVARSECGSSGSPDPAGLRCDVYTIGADGTIGAEPVFSGLRFSMGADATAPSNATVGATVTVAIPEHESSLISATSGYDILDHSEFARTFTITGATIVPGSLVQDPPADPSAETTATATDSTVTLGRMTPVPGGGDVRFPAARFDIVPDAPGTVTIVFGGYDSTIRVRGSDGVERRVRAKCTTDDRVLATIAVS